MRKVLILTAILSMLTLDLLATPAFANDASSSSDLQQKISQIQQEIASKAAQITNQVTQKIDNKVYAGVVLASDDTSITVSASPDEQETITTDQYTDFEYGKGLKHSIGKGDYVVGLGDVDDKGNLVAKKVIKQDPPDNLVVSWGRVKSSSSSAIIVEDQNRRDFAIRPNISTSFQFGNDQGSIKDVEVNRSVIFSGFENKDKSIQARFIYVFKQGFVDLFKQKSPSSSSGKTPASAKHS